MIYLIYGENPSSVRKFINDILEKQGGQFLIVDLGIGLGALQSLLSDPSRQTIFSNKIAYILKDSLSGKKPISESIGDIEKLKKTDRDAAVFFIEKNDVKIEKDKLAFFTQHGKIFKIIPPSPKEIRTLVQERIKEGGYEFEAGAIDFLADNLGGDCENIMVELKKVMTYSAKDKKITKKTVAFLIKPKIETSIFRTIDAISTRNKKEALMLISEHLESGDKPLYILKMIAFQFRNILSVKQKEESFSSAESFASFKDSFPGIHPFVVQKSLYQAKKFSLIQLKKIYKKLFQIDLSIKKGKISPREGLELFILDL